MKMHRKPTNLLIALTITVLSLAAVLVAAAQSPDSAAPLQVEVAEDGGRFVFDDLNLYEDGMPAYGSAFVTQGYIYPAGTLNGSNGVLENGEPEFPELVLGEWTCYGWMIGDGARTETGEWVVSTQIYKFNDGSMIVTDGFEIVDFDQPVTRAISSGTGEYRSARGEMVQVLQGFTDAMGVNLSVSFDFDSE
ncbi:MAG TPA: hypothetical protein PKX07_15285 [Aggregatilineales bacterium]|nr:hypothetical protein [Aggregatilineales bacterium]